MIAFLHGKLVDALPTQVTVDVNLLFEPMFEVKVHEETDERFVYTDIDGAIHTFELGKGGVVFD